MDIKQRFAMAAFIAAEYDRFEDFALAGMKFLGFPLTDMQSDIAEFMANGPRLRMVMAQRGEAKSTLAALYAVWRLIQQPTTRVLIISGGETQASEVASLIIRLILRWDMLEYMRPDKLAGDKTSLDAFEIHWAIRGMVDKSPSVACVGITAQLQGKRGDLIIADDIETTKNGLTVTQRQHLLLLSKEFSSMCTHGDILYLGTPQTKDSIYNTLPGRGFTIRIWPGRYPTDEELEKYGDRLAPYLSDRIRVDPTLQCGGGIDGKRGKPADPGRFDEDALVEKELDQGPEGFQLQFMLDTSLSDAARQQLRLSDLIVANFSNDLLPEIIGWQASPTAQVDLPADFPIPLTRLYYAITQQAVHLVARPSCMMYVDPAGGGGDEIGYGVSCAVGAYIHVFDVGGIKGGLTEENGELIVEIVKEFGVTHIQVESNMGAGLFEINLRAILQKHNLPLVGVAGEWSTGQKERRIIDSLVGAMQRHKVIIHQRVFESDIRWGKQHSIDKRAGYSMFYQLANITTDRGSLVHDDRLEALAGCVRFHKAALAVDEHRAAEQRRLAAAKGYLENPMGYKDPGWRNQQGPPAKGIRRTINSRRARY